MAQPIHRVPLDESIVDLILSFDPEDLWDSYADPQPLITEYRKWAETIREAVADGLDIA